MDPTYLHLVLNHFPILGSLFGAILLAAGLLRKEGALVKAALLTLIFSAVLAIAVFQTGEAAEEVVEKIAGISEEAVNAHEEAAEWVIWLIELMGVMALLGFITHLKQKKIANTIAYLVLVTAFIAFGTLAYVGNLGGKIRHTEIQQSLSPDERQKP